MNSVLQIFPPAQSTPIYCPIMAILGQHQSEQNTIRNI